MPAANVQQRAVLGTNANITKEAFKYSQSILSAVRKFANLLGALHGTNERNHLIAHLNSPATLNILKNKFLLF